jgi:hypothetical protein
MKRSEMVELIRAAVQESNADFGWYETEQAEFVLKAIEEAGILPPTNTCKLIPDETKGGTKHSPSERKWDDE